MFMVLKVFVVVLATVFPGVGIAVDVVQSGVPQQVLAVMPAPQRCPARMDTSWGILGAMGLLLAGAGICVFGERSES